MRWALAGALAVLVGLLVWRALAEAPPPSPPPVGTLTLALVDPDGAPLRACAASLWRVVDGGRRLAADGNRACADGLSWRDLPAGPWRLLVAAPGYAQLDRSLTLPADQGLDLGVLTPPPGADLRGRVTWEGQGVAGARIRVAELDRDPVRADAQGRYLLPGLPEGPLTVQAAADDPARAAEAPVDVRAGAALQVDLVLRSIGRFGFHLAEGPDGPVIDRLVPGLPAEGCGLRVGDVLRAVDGIPVAGLDPARRDALLAGAVGQESALVVATQAGTNTVRCARGAI